MSFKIVRSFKLLQPGILYPVMYAEMSDGTYAKAYYDDCVFIDQVITKDEYASAFLEQIIGARIE